MTTHVDIVADFDNRSVMASANDLKRSVAQAGDDAGKAYGQGFTKGADGRIRDERGRFVKAGQDLGGDLAKGMNDGLQRGLPAFKIGLSGAIDATRGFHDEQKKLQDLMRNGAAWDLVAQQAERTSSAHKFAAAAARDAGGAFSEFEKAGKTLANTASDTTGSLTALGGAIGKLGNIAGPAAIVGLGAAIVQLGGIAASASQSLALIPAAAGAAGVAIGTVALATWGFGDALKAVGDPQKFGEALKQLSPNAQQAALSIQALMPAFKQLQQATSDAFFANVGPQLNQLANQLLPTIQSMTTGVASAMNQMFSGVAQQLMTPQTQQAIQQFTTNVVSAFQQLAPAIAPLVQAFANLSAVGSGFLPELAKAAADAARNFSAFITQAQASGDLKKFIGEGLDTLRQLGGIAMDLVKAFMALAPVGQQILPQISTMLHDIQTIMPAIAAASLLLGPPIGLWAVSIKQASTAFEAIKGVVVGVANAVIPVINTIGEALDNMFEPIRKAASLIGIDIPHYTGVNQIGGVPTQGGYAGAQAERRGTAAGSALPTAGIPGTPDGGFAFPGTSWFPGQQKPGTWGGPAAARTQNADGTWGTKGSAASTALPAAPVTPYNTGLPAGFEGLPQTPALYSAQSSYMDANTDLANKRARANQLEQSNVATAEDIQKAKNDVIEAERNQHEAELRLYAARDDALNKTTKQLDGYASQMGDIGVKLDQDLGISKGLPGLAENLVRFLGSLAAAPLEANLQAISNAPGQAQGGFGLMGILGAQGAFGPQFTAAGQAAANSNSASAMGPTAFQVPGGGGGAPSEAQVKQIAASFGLQVTSEDRPGDSGYHGKGMALDLSNGSANTPQMKAFADYMATNFGTSLKELIYSDPGFSSLIGDGKNVTGSGYYSPGTLAEHRNHVHVAAAWGQGGGGAGGPSDATGRFWDAIAAKESSGNWQNPDTGGSGHYGGLQFSPSTWNAFGGQEFAPMPQQATREQQIAVADRTAFTGYNGTKPQGLGAWEVITNGSTAPDGITVNSPRPGGGVGAPFTAATAPAATSQFGSGLPIPLPVTIVGGGGSGGGGWFSGGPPAAPGAGTPSYTGTDGTPYGANGLPMPAAAPSPFAGSGYTPGGTPGAVPVPGAMGGPLGMPPAPGGPGAGPTPIGGVDAPGGSGKGGVSMTSGGLLDSALSGAAAGLDLLAPGAGQAAQVGIKLANRAIQYGGQAAGIGVQGLMNTFLPTGGSELANNSWITKIAGGIAGAAPALPNMAGKGAPPPPDQQGQGKGQQGGNTTTNNFNVQEDPNRGADGTGRDIAYHQQAAALPAGRP